MGVVKDFGVTELTQRGEYTSRTYRMDFENKRILGMVDGIEALHQHIIKVLRTPRFKSLIYDSDFGCELEDAIIAQDATPEYIQTDAPRMIREALLVDSRFTAVENFEIVLDGDTAQISFEAATIYGTIGVKEVI